ncbi:MAG: hypothetical protein KAG06_05750, partial [Methylococcales bacterium]|nr:hypothetical protein [Methylococcales bacterium]
KKTRHSSQKYKLQLFVAGNDGNGVLHKLKGYFNTFYKGFTNMIGVRLILNKKEGGGLCLVFLKHKLLKI